MGYQHGYWLAIVSWLWLGINQSLPVQAYIPSPSFPVLTLNDISDDRQVGATLSANQSGASLTVGMGVSASASVGYGETDGSTAWVSQQTSVIGSDSVNIKVGGHTQVDGALIANLDDQGKDQGNLSLNTRTLGFTDLKDHHDETRSYLSVSVGVNGGSGHANTQQRPNSASDGATNGDGSGSGTSWSVSGSYYDLDRRQDTLATLGLGSITVREDQASGNNSTAGLNRDTTQAQTITKDKERAFDIYLSNESIDAVKGLTQTDANGNNRTLARWQNNIASVIDPEAYGQIGAKAVDVSNPDTWTDMEQNNFWHRF